MIVSQNSTPGSALFQALWTIFSHSLRADIADPWMVAIDRKLLCEVTILCGCPHKLVADPDADIGPRHLALLHLGIDESPRVGVLDGDREHQCAPSSVLCHLPRGIAEAFHERHQSRRGEGGVVDRSAFGTDLAGLVGLLKGICLFFLHTVKFFNQIAKLQILFRLWKKTRRFFARWYCKDGQRGAIKGGQPPCLEASRTTSSPQFPIERGKKPLRMAEDSDLIRKFVR